MFKGHIITKESQSESFILTNKLGGYFLFGWNSKFRGLFFADEKEGEFTLFKTLENITFSKTPVEIINKLYSVEIVFNDAKIELLLHKNSLLAKVTGCVEITISVDMRHIYDFTTQGRIYNIKNIEKGIEIGYKKYKDNSLSTLEYERFLEIKSNSQLKSICRWREQFYGEDKLRNSSIDSLWVYDAITICIEKNDEIAFSFSKNCLGSENNALKVVSNFNAIFERETHYANITHKFHHIKDTKIKFALLLCENSFDMLFSYVEKKEGIFAGLPWFFQFWARDEAVCLGALIKQKKYGLAKSIIMRHISEMQDNGRISNRYPYSVLGSADATGLIFLQSNQLLSILEKEKLIPYFFGDNNYLEIIKEKLEYSVKKHLELYYEEGLIKNSALETWMDSSIENDTRAGFRIEIQALFLSMLQFLIRIKKVAGEDCESVKKIHDELLYKVQKYFFDGRKLADGLNDWTARPNIFIAYYAYPNLLTKEEWEIAFDYAISRLWLSWGGFSSIDKSSPLFCNEHTGEDNRSYHRGDSWFWINNLAAISMHRFNRKKYRKFIEKIIYASSEEILFKGAIGHHAELSNAKELNSKGCLMQGWSAASFIEMIDEIKN
ncbi:MAG: amylo-alpha-1,6-glucosidase [archaeon]